MKDHFEKIVGLGNVSDNENDLLAYGYDGSELAGKARLVVWPNHEEQLRMILSFCNRSNIDVIMRGNGSNPCGMTVPNNSIVVCTQNFDRIHTLNTGEGWVKVDAGVTVAHLNETIAAQGFRYPIETKSALTTIGSLLARNGASRYSERYGKAADTVIELEVMDGTGKFFTVTKDITEHLGTEGTVFIIIRAKLKIVSLTERSADIHYFETVQQAIEHVHTTKEQHPLAIEFLDSAAATYAGINTKHTVITEWNDNRGAHKYENYVLIVQKREHVRKSLGVKGYIHIDDSTVASDKITEAIEWCRQKELPVVAHAGIGIVHPFFKREQETLREEWYEWLHKNNQDVSGQFGYGLRKKKYAPPRLKNRIRVLKERHDYNNILCRGKLYDFI
jgi:FAD/FMN-containing dehydrogenase